MEYLNDHEQVERLKKWWKEYGFAIVGGVIIAILFVISWRYYRHHKEVKLAEASSLYTTMMNNVFTHQLSSAESDANALKQQYKKTPYSAYAALWLAKNAVQAENFADAKTQLTWVMTYAHMKAIRQVARIRFAKIQLQMKEPKAALETLDKEEDSSYIGLIDEVRADAYLQAGDKAKAQYYYKKALKETPKVDVLRPMLTIKSADLPAPPVEQKQQQEKANANNKK